MMESIQYELVSDYLVMASTLAEIKSRMLIPHDDEDEDEEDPRANLVKRLLEYQKYNIIGTFNPYNIFKTSLVFKSTILLSIRPFVKDSAANLVN